MSHARLIEELWSWLLGVRTRRPPRPRVGIELAPCIPAWTLRLACAAAATACLLLVASHGAHWAIGGALIATMAARPGGAAPALFAVGVGLRLVGSEADPFAPRVFLLVLGLHLTVQLAAVVGDLAWPAAVERRVLVAFAKPFIGIQALAQTAALLGAWATSRQLTVTWLPVVAGTGLAVTAWAVLIRLRAGSDQP